jgi:hypothetical protein
LDDTTLLEDDYSSNPNSRNFTNYHNHKKLLSPSRIEPTTSHLHRLNHDNHKKFKLVTNFYKEDEEKETRGTSPSYIDLQARLEHQHNMNFSSAVQDDRISDILHNRLTTTALFLPHKH